MHPMKFQENLPILRKQAGLTQEALAERLAVSRQSVSKWESYTYIYCWTSCSRWPRCSAARSTACCGRDLSERDSRAETEARRAEEADRQAEETFLAYDDMQNFLARTVAAGVGAHLPRAGTDARPHDPMGGGWDAAGGAAAHADCRGGLSLYPRRQQGGGVRKAPSGRRRPLHRG